MISFPGSFTFISDEVSQDPAVVAAFARRHGFTTIELRSMLGRSFRDLTPADVAEVARVMRGEGLKVVGCATPVFKCPVADAGQRREHLEIFRRSVEVAQTLGAPLLRVFTFLRGDGAPSDSDLARAAAGVNELLPLCPAGIEIGVENEASCLMGTGAETERFLLGGADRRLTVVWDACNVLYVPGYTGSATEAFSRIVNRVGHIHIKDAVRRAGGLEACKLGDGETGWREHFREINRSGYRGLVSLETHWRVKSLDAASLHLPGGFGFSEGGEAASEICVTAIPGLLKS